MRLNPFHIIIALIFIVSSCNAPKVNSERIVLIALDGISVEAYQTAKLPNLKQLVSEGSISLNTRNVMPSVTLPNWTSHLTGSGPEQHGIVDNGWTLKKHILPSIDTDVNGYFPSIFNLVKEQVPNVKTAFYYNWKNLIYPYNQAFIDEVSFQENDKYVENYEKAFSFIVNNQASPTLVYLYSVHTDHAGHSHGWMSPEYIKSIEEADVHIGKFLSQLKDEGLYADTHFMFVSDHGGNEKKGHGGVTTTEMEVPWSITGPGIKKSQQIKEPNNTVNTAATVAYLFNCQQPLSWTGEVPFSIFE